MRGKWVHQFARGRRAGSVVDTPAVWGVFVFYQEEHQLSTNERERRVRINRMIRISPVRVISDAGEQLGVLAVEDALAMAEEKGLDLVEVAPMARPPVVKIMDYGKYKFEEAKAARAAKKKQHVIEVKEIKFRPGIDDHDFDFKVRHMREFLKEGNKVKVTMMFRGRQMARLSILARPCWTEWRSSWWMLEKLSSMPGSRVGR